MKELITTLSAITSAGITVYWILVFTKIVRVNDVIPGYRNWFMAFPLADFWIAACSFLTAYFLLLENEKATVFGLLTGSSLIFLGLYALTYGVRTGLIFRRTADTLIEVIIKFYSLIVGVLFINYFSALI